MDNRFLERLKIQKRRRTNNNNNRFLEAQACYKFPQREKCLTTTKAQADNASAQGQFYASQDDADQFLRNLNGKLGSAALMTDFDPSRDVEVASYETGETNVFGYWGVNVCTLGIYLPLENSGLRS